jgi:hypothetical protein
MTDHEMRNAQRQDELRLLREIERERNRFVAAPRNADVDAGLTHEQALQRLRSERFRALRMRERAAK